MQVGSIQAPDIPEYGNVDEYCRETVHVQKEKKPIDARRNSSNIDEDSSLLQILSPGYRFEPKDRELIQWYLKKKVMKQQLPLNRIYEVNLYNYNPYDLAFSCTAWGDREWYFFTPRDRKYPNGKRPNRVAGDGYWKATGADKIIEVGQVVIGARKSLVFYRGKQSKGIKTDWLMHEYRIDGLEENKSTRTEDNMRLDDWVLCKIYKRKRKEKSGEDDSMDSNDGQAVQSSLSSSPSTQIVLAGAPTATMPLMPTPAPVSYMVPAYVDEPKPIDFSFSHYYQEQNLDYLYADAMFFNPIESCDPELPDQAYSHTQPR